MLNTDTDTRIGSPNVGDNVLSCKHWKYSRQLSAVQEGFLKLEIQ